MTATWAVARRELATFFNSAIAYIVLGAFLLVAGYLYFNVLFLAGQASLRGFFSIAPLLFVIFTPAITMRLVAEERKSGTIELLLTLPMEDWQLVAGKFLAALGMILAGLLFTLPYALTVAALAAPGAHFDWGAAFAGYVGLVLLACSLLAIGMWASAMSKNQIVGFIVALVIGLALFLVDKLAIFMPDVLGEVLEFLSVDWHFENIARGVFDTRDIVFYLSLTVAGLALTTRTLAATRK